MMNFATAPDISTATYYIDSASDDDFTPLKTTWEFAP